MSSDRISHASLTHLDLISIRASTVFVLVAWSQVPLFAEKGLGFLFKHANGLIMESSSFNQMHSPKLERIEKKGIAREMSPQLLFLLMYCVFNVEYWFPKVSRSLWLPHRFTFNVLQEI
jgi:hypothetical protein